MLFSNNNSRMPWTYMNLEFVKQNGNMLTLVNLKSVSVKLIKNAWKNMAHNLKIPWSLFPKKCNHFYFTWSFCKGCVTKFICFYFLIIHLFVCFYFYFRAGCMEYDRLKQLLWLLLIDWYCCWGLIGAVSRLEGLYLTTFVVYLYFN
jgi:hypothetical protein